MQNQKNYESKKKKKKGALNMARGYPLVVWREQRSFSDSSFWHKKQNQSPLQIIAFSIATGGTAPTAQPSGASHH
jgi:hypothetical protein